MRLLRRMLLRQFLPIFLVALVFFLMLLQLIDIFGNIWRYFAHDVPAGQVARIALLYLPKCVSFALPVSFLFAVAYTLGLFYANNELFAIFGSGVSLYRLVRPFLVLGVMFSVGGFFFEDAVVIPTFQAKNETYAQAVQAGRFPQPVERCRHEPGPAGGVCGGLLQRCTAAADRGDGGHPGCPHDAAHEDRRPVRRMARHPLGARRLPHVCLGSADSGF